MEFNYEANIERYLDGDLPEGQARLMADRAAADPDLDRELALRRALRQDLAVLERHPVPANFDARILAVLFPARTEGRALAGAAARIYLALSCVLGLMALSLSALLVQRRGVEVSAIQGVTGALELFASLGGLIISGVNFVEGVVKPLTVALRPVFNGLITTANVTLPAVMPMYLALLSVVGLSILWLVVSRRRRVPHALSL